LGLYCAAGAAGGVAAAGTTWLREAAWDERTEHSPFKRHLADVPMSDIWM
jgi:hypothetical protein